MRASGLPARVVVTLALLAGAAALGIPTAGAQALRAERPTYEVGDRWIRSDGVFELVRIEQDMYVFAAEGRPTYFISRNLSLARVVQKGVEEFSIDPPVPFAWPLEVGKGGTSTAVVRRRAETPSSKRG
jgi:hypothetical protein